MNTDELLALLVRHREDLRRWLDDDQYRTFLTMLERLREAGTDPERVAMATMAVVRSLWPVPDDAGELARAVHLHGRSVAVTAAVPSQDAVLAALEALYAAPSSTPPGPRREPEPGPGPGPGPTAEPASEPATVAALVAAAKRRLLAEPSRAAAPVGSPSAGSEPADVIVLADPETGPRSPDFQFDPGTGRPRDIVVRVNRILLADRDPWGAADWWLGGNSWLGGRPAALIGQIPDERLADAALALVEEGR
ncbi:hypothetical protein MUK60_18690 [Streptomyces sp. LRE541]|uniref:hypothetical protein n=1 Tax=Streptomyces sp. LRE541 TaxID=2931983 RepID=UPI00200C2392|nr:hypothetical protein [Streptomyces sp. LRE541]UPZ29645.1 hypothetical protein MUK60_18690 [Streptomyces sp. LRE541]